MARERVYIRCSTTFHNQRCTGQVNGGGVLKGIGRGGSTFMGNEAFRVAIPEYFV